MARLLNTSGRSRSALRIAQNIVRIEPQNQAAVAILAESWLGRFEG